MHYNHQNSTESPMESPVVAITGGSQGLGYEFAKVLLLEGFRVSICARTKQTLNHAVTALAEYGKAEGFVGDISDPMFQERFISETVRLFGRLDGVINNASTLGDLPLPSLMETTLENLRAVFEVNVLAPVALLQKALPHFTAHGRSLVIGISSDAAIGGYPQWGVYGASKAALDLLHKTLASELGDRTVYTYAIDPGDMATAMHEAAIPGDTGLVDPKDVANAVLPLFRSFRSGEPLPAPSGSRLQVREGTLVTGEGE